MHLRHHYWLDAVYMSRPCCEWGGALSVSDIRDSVTAVVTSSIHSSCRSHGVDL